MRSQRLSAALACALACTATGAIAGAPVPARAAAPAHASTADPQPGLAVDCQSLDLPSAVAIARLDTLEPAQAGSTTADTVFAETIAASPTFDAQSLPALSVQALPADADSFAAGPMQTLVYATPLDATADVEFQPAMATVLCLPASDEAGRAPQRSQARRAKAQ